MSLFESSAAVVSSAGRIIDAPGEMAALVQERDWAATCLGPIEKWPDVLVAQVNTVLAAQIPLQLLWGPEMILFYNDAFAPLLADRYRQGLGQPARVFWHDAWPIVGEQLESVLHHGKTVQFSRALVPIMRNGVLTNVYWDYTYIPVLGNLGEVLGVLDIVQDVTQAVMTQKELEENRTELQFALDAAGQGTWHYDPVRNVVSGDERMCRMFGVSAPEGPASYWIDQIHPEDRERVAAEFTATLEQGAPYETEYRVVLPQSIRWLRAKAQAKVAENGTTFLLGIVEDITQRKHDEVLLRQSEKLAAVGRLASTVSHEINNPLASVTNLIFLARSETAGSEADEFLELAERELRRVSAITNQALHFYKQSSAPHAVRCDDLFATVLINYQSRLVNSQITVAERFAAKKPVLCYENEILQVLSNLVGNAVDAMRRSGGTLYVRSREGQHWKTGEQGHYLTIADTGTGISAADLPRIFDPFFSTKGIGGIGLGLWISREAVRRHGGEIRVRTRRSSSRSGTVFTLFLPGSPSLTRPD